jgi:hypothetical protein|tara:strand:+ start:1493 stop:1957 length:465 start_codon:yes stop_codon:yes gene_type:complete
MSLSAQKKIGHVLRKYKNDENVMNINLNGDLTKMLSEGDVKVESKIDLLDVLVFSKGTDVKEKHKLDIKNTLASQGFDLLVNVKDKNGKLKLYTKENEDFIEEVYAHVFTNEMNIHFILAGEIKYSDLSKINLGFEGSQFFNDAVGNGDDSRDK